MPCTSSTTARRSGLRLALAHPERVTAIISQNGNAYEEGLSAGLAGRSRSAAREPTEDKPRTAWRAASNA